MVHKIHLDGLDMRVKFFGNGPLVFFVHGFGGSPNDWNEVIEILQHDYCVVKLDLKPIYQGSNAYSFDQQQEFLKQTFLKCIEAFGECEKESFHVVATSYGAAVTLGAISDVKDQVRSLTLINPMPNRPISKMKANALKFLFLLHQVPGGIKYFVHTGFGIKLMLYLAKVFKVETGYKERSVFTFRQVLIIQKAVERFLWIVRGKDWAEYRNKILTNKEIPSYLVYGESDPLYSQETYREFKTWLNIKKEKACPLGGHVLLKSHARVISDELYEFVKLHEVRESFTRLDVEDAG